MQPFAKQKDRLMSNFDFNGNNSTEMQTTPGQTPIQLTHMRTVTGLSGQTIRESQVGHMVDIRLMIRKNSVDQRILLTRSISANRPIRSYKKALY